MSARRKAILITQGSPIKAEPLSELEEIALELRTVRIKVQAYVSEVQVRMDLLRSTADDLASGKINAFHAANRIRRIANEVAKEK